MNEQKTKELIMFWVLRDLPSTPPIATDKSSGQPIKQRSSSRMHFGLVSPCFLKRILHQLIIRLEASLLVKGGRGHFALVGA